jgi:hypothetical protein
VKNSEAASGTDDAKVRIFMFDQMQWRTTFNQVIKIISYKPHFSIMEFIAIDNERLIPQQSISSVTNVDDIETYIRSMETETTQYLKIIDLPLTGSSACDARAKRNGNYSRFPVPRPRWCM